jgi:hypothetical protein
MPPFSAPSLLHFCHAAEKKTHQLKTVDRSAQLRLISRTSEWVYKIYQRDKKPGHDVGGPVGSGHPCLAHGHTLSKMVPR